MGEKLLEVCKVTPPPGSAADICLPLTFLDLFGLRIPQPQQIFFYETHLSESLFSGSVLPKLKNSLSVTLRHFLPLAGNLIWPSSSPNPVIRYKEGDGVLLTVAVSDADLDHLTSKNIRECRIFRPLVARIVGSNSELPVIAIKVTLFPKKGFCIGVAVHHCLLDAKSMTLFMKSWASISKFGENKNGLGPELTPVFDRKNVRKKYADIENLYIEVLKKNGVTPNGLAILESKPPPGTLRGTFELSGLDVKKLKEFVRAHLVKCEQEEFSQVPYISTFAVTYAYVILCLVKAKGQAINRLRIGFPFDCRGRLEPPLSANYFGNCIGFSAKNFDGGELLGTDLNLMIAIMSFIVKSIKGLDNGALRGAEEWLADDLKTAADIKTTKIYIVGSPKFEYRNIDFGWGKPKKTDMTYVDGIGGVTYSDGNGGGVEVELSLISHEMERFASVFAQGLREMMKHGSASL